MSKTKKLKNIRSRYTWEKRLACYLDVFDLALMWLGQEKEPPIPEQELNRRLECKLAIAIAELDEEEKLGCPVAEAKNPADPKFDTTQPHEKKKPDFQWQYIDRSTPGEPETRSFTIECKRLGNPVRGRNLNKEYVTRGVVRFWHPGWCYGRDLSVGAMIGYIQASDHDRIHAEINEALRREEIEALVPSDPRWREGAISKLAHSFEREFPVSPFCLTHFWLDLRNRKNAA